MKSASQNIKSQYSGTERKEGGVGWVYSGLLVQGSWALITPTALAPGYCGVAVFYNVQIHVYMYNLAYV